MEMGRLSDSVLDKQKELRLRWVDEEDMEMDVEQGSISSEETAGSCSDNELRVGVRHAQDIWNRNDVEDGLRALPGSEEVSTLLESGDEAGLVNHSHGQTTGLLIASWKGNTHMLTRLLDAGASTCVTDAEGRTPLHLAACARDAGCVNILLEHEASVQVWDSHHRATPLHCAASAGNLTSLRLILKAGADVNAGLTGRSALHYAVQSSAIDCARELLKAGANPNTPQVYTETPLHVAAAMGSAVCVRLLLEHGANVRVQFGPQKTTALHLAAEDENAECSKLLLDAGAEINAQNDRHQTPLHIAALSQSGEILELLLQRGADPNAEDTDGRTPLHSAIVKIYRSCECVRLLLDAGAKVNKPDAFGYTPLHIAALNEISSCVYLLLTYGGDVTARTNGGVSALSFIVRRTPDILPRILSQMDASIKLHDHEIGDVDCELKLDFRILVPSVERGESGLLLTLIEVGQRHILKHPLCETFLFLKWKRIRKFFLFSLFFHTIFVLLYSGYMMGVYLRNCPMPVSNETRTNDMDTCNILMVVKVTGYVLLAFDMLLIAKELFQMAHSWETYVTHWENWLQWLIIISVFPCVLHHHSADDVSQDVLTWQHHVAAIGIFLTWIELMMLVGRFPIFGLYVQMFTTVALNFAKFLLAYSCLLVAFSLSFGVLFPNYKSFRNIAWGLMKTVVMMSGELEFEDIFYATESPILYPITAHLIFLAFVLLVTVILTNLMVGLAVNDIQGLQQSAGLDRLVRQAELVAHLESMLFSRLLRCLPNKLLTLCHRSALLTFSPYHRSLYIRPNDPRENRIPRELVKNAYHLVAERKEKSRHRLRYSSTSSDNAIRCSDGDYVKIVYPQSRYSVKSETESRGTCPNSKHRQCDSTIDQLLSHMAALTDELQQRDIITTQRLNMLTEEINALRKDFKSI
ncbi:Transient receptor potential channel pyrexia [Cryptotermes secundus]|uniref:Transient receptor potential channel pyrexia n=3 Tax=Cryptotermes secundus TaxID=105785 RepID=A0A2J7Q265_9NEOP|nr:Transient receptor potential channel pyrexia [Cryptotermes secundus]